MYAASAAVSLMERDALHCIWGEDIGKTLSPFSNRPVDHEAMVTDFGLS